MSKTSNPTTREVGIANSNAIVYDDLQVTISGVRLLGSNDPSWSNVTLDGVTVQLLTFDTNHEVELFVQTTHSTKLSTLIEKHIHWTVGNGASDDNYMAFQVTGVGAPIGGSFTSIGTLTSANTQVTSATEGKHNYLDIGDIPNTFNTTVSTIFVLKLTRVAPSGETDSTANISIVFSDCHIQKDTIGSLQETSKS